MKVCKECGKDEMEVKFAFGAKTCNVCYHKHRVAKRALEGTCIECGKGPLFTKTLCEKCARKKRELRSKKIEQGTCVYNGCNEAFEQGNTYCRKHADGRNSADRQRRKDKIKSSVCTECLDVVESGFTMCQKHLDIQGIRGRKSRYNYSAEDEQKWQDAIAGKFPCAFCGLPFNGETPNQDHDHKCCSGNKSCGKCRRGLVHPLCNTKGILWFEWYEQKSGSCLPMLKEYRDKFTGRTGLRREQ